MYSSNEDSIAVLAMAYDRHSVPVQFSSQNERLYVSNGT